MTQNSAVLFYVAVEAWNDDHTLLPKHLRSEKYGVKVHVYQQRKKRNQKTQQTTTKNKIQENYKNISSIYLFYTFDFEINITWWRQTEVEIW